MKNFHLISTLAIIALVIALALIFAGDTIIKGSQLSQIEILDEVPDVRQPNNYSCGPTSLQAVLAYYGVDKRIDELIILTKSSENGTPPENIVEAARQLGFQAQLKENMTLNDLESYLDQGIPVIINCQAWRESEIPWSEDEEDGHYMVVIGIDQKNVYLEDPKVMGSRGMIPCQEFLDRWHDQSTRNPKIKYYHLGIIINGSFNQQPPFIRVK